MSSSTMNWSHQKFSIAPAAMRARVPVGRRVGKPGIGQDAINMSLIEAAQSGQRAVRLKGGDPFVFGRGGEEVEALREAGVAYSIIPGITAGLGAAAQFEVPLTFRHEALRITFLTAHKAKRRRNRRLVDADRHEDDGRRLYGHDRGAVGPRRPSGRGPLAANPGRRVRAGDAGRMRRPWSARSTELPDLVEQIDGGPAILIIGDVVAHSAPWRHSNPYQVISDTIRKLPNDLSP